MSTTIGALVQKTLLFSPPPAIDGVNRPNAARWRETFELAGLGTREQWNGVRIDVNRQKLNLYAGNPAANDLLVTHLDGIAGCIADAFKAPVPFEMVDRAVGVRAGTEQLWAYRVPYLVAEKKGDFAPHMTPQIDASLRERIERKIEQGIRRELEVWGRLPASLADAQAFLAIADPGRAVIIRAIESGRSGHAKQVGVLVRRNLVFLSYWRIEGRLFVGGLRSLGYGRVDRASAPEVLSVDLQRQLIKIIPESAEA